MITERTLLPDHWRVESSIAAIEREWCALEAEAIATPFQSYGWTATLLQEVKNPNAAFVLGYRDGKLRALFPLSVERGQLSWLNDSWTNYNMPLVAADLFTNLDALGVDRMWADVRAALGNPKATLLRRQLIDIDGRKNPFADWAKVHEPTNSYAITLGGDWKTFYAALHTPTTRKTLERKLRKLEKEGALEWVRVTEPKAIFDHIMLMLEWKSEQLDALGRRNPFAQMSNRQILARVAASYPKGRLYAVHLGGKPVSINFLVEGGDRLIIYQMAYESGPASRWSPGRLLLNHVLEEAIEQKHVLLDLSVGDDPYKLELSDRITGMTNSVKAHSVSGIPAVLKERAWILLKTLVKGNPVLLRAVLKLKAASLAAAQTRLDGPAAATMKPRNPV